MKEEIKFKEKEYEVSRISLLIEDVEEITAMAVKAVSQNGSGGFPARVPLSSESVLQEK